MSNWKDITHLSERLEAFEERHGVHIEGLYITSQEPTQFRLTGEVHSRQGASINHPLAIVVTVHDKLGRVVDRGSRSISSEAFFGIKSFEFNFTIPVSLEDVVKIRVYPDRGY